MSQHILTITLVIEVPDGPDHDASRDALASTVTNMLDEGVLQDWILDGAADFDDFDDDTESVHAECSIKEVPLGEQVLTERAVGEEQRCTGEYDDE